MTQRDLPSQYEGRSGARLPRDVSTVASRACWEGRRRFSERFVIIDEPEVSSTPREIFHPGSPTLGFINSKSSRAMAHRFPPAAEQGIQTPRERDGLHGLITVRIISKARPCAKLTGMIEADLAPISHVSGSHQLGRTLHEVIIFTIIMTRQRCGGAMCSACTEPVVRSVGCYCTRRTCCASGATHTCR